MFYDEDILKILKRFLRNVVEICLIFTKVEWVCKVMSFPYYYEIVDASLHTSN